MKKVFVLVLLCAMLPWGLQAQVRKNKQEISSFAVGIKGGVNLPRMLYWGNDALSQLHQEISFRPVAGVFVEIPMGKTVMLAPEAMYVQRGTEMKYQHYSGSDVHYTLQVSYADLRLPVEIRWPLRPYLQPYLTLGAEFGMRLGGSIEMERTAPIFLKDSIPVGDANMALLHSGAFGGIGIRSRIDLGSMDLVIKLSATYHQGLLDTYSTMEKEGTVTAGNVNAYQITGQRLPQGIEVNLGLAIPLNFDAKKDACSAFSHDRYRHRSGHGRLYGF